MIKRCLIALLALILVSAAGCVDPITDNPVRRAQDGLPEAAASTAPMYVQTPEPTGDDPETIEAALGQGADASGIGETELTPDELRELAFGAVLTARNPMHYRNLGGLNDDVVFGAYTTLYSAYGVFDRASALETLDWLKDEGHRGHYHTMLDHITGLDPSDIADDDSALITPVGNACRALYEALLDDYGYTEQEIGSVDSVMAWDMDRLVTVARWCYTSGYIAEDEAWAYIGFAAEMAVREYDSWRGYFAGVMLGHAIWSRDQEFTQQNREVANALLKNADSIYNCVPFAPPAGERRASRVYETYEDKQAERMRGKTFGVSGMDVLTAFEDGLSDDYAIDLDEERLRVSAICETHSHFLTVYEASNGEVNRVYLTLSPFDTRSLEDAIADVLAEYERLCELLGTSVEVMTEAFDLERMEVKETVVNTDTIKDVVVQNAEMTVESGGVTYQAQYAFVDGKMASVTVVVSKW